MKWLGLGISILALCVSRGWLPASNPSLELPRKALDSALKQEILRATPGLPRQLAAGNDYEAARMILGWVAPRIPGSSRQQLVDTTSLSAGQIWFDHFRRVRNGVWCGGAADFFNKALHLFHIRSVTLDFGDRSFWTHVTVLVKQRSDSPAPWMMLGPTYNIEIVSRRTHKPVPFARAVRLAAHGEADRVLTVRSRSLANRPLLLANGGHARCGTNFPSGMCGFKHYLSDPSLRARGYVGLGGMLQIFGDGKIFAPHIEPPEIIRLHRDISREIAIQNPV